MYLAGQNSGNAVLDLLLGEANPCGKLAETWPLALEDTPCYGFFGNKGNVEYRESIYVGYRYYDKARKEVAYPFGHGLSYTEFAYSNLKLTASEIGETDTVDVSVTVTNTGNQAGKEVVQLYVAPPLDGIFRPKRELRAFTKVLLQPGESKTVSMTLNSRAFAYYDVNSKDWRVDSGIYAIQIGSSSRDIRLTQNITVHGLKPDPAINLDVPAYFDPVSNWPVSKEEFERVLGHLGPPERVFVPSLPTQLLVRFRQVLQDACSIR